MAYNMSKNFKPSGTNFLEVFNKNGLEYLKYAICIYYDLIENKITQKYAFWANVRRAYKLYFELLI